MALLTRVRRVRILGAVAGLVAVSGCSGDEVLGLRDDMYAVHALLLAGQDTASVRVTRTDPTLPLGEELVVDASVRLVRGGGTVDLVLDPARVSGPASLEAEYRGAVPGGIVAGESFSLAVTLPAGNGNVHGVTTILGPPQIESPPSGYRVTMGTTAIVPLQVAAEGSAGGVHHVRVRTAFTSGGAVSDPACELPTTYDPDLPPTPVTEWTSLEIPAASCRTAGGDPLAWDSLDVDVSVVVFDSAYVRYARAVFESAGAYFPDLSFGIHGAMGFLASGAEASTVVRVVRPE